MHVITLLVQDHIILSDCITKMNNPIVIQWHCLTWHQVLLYEMLTILFLKITWISVTSLRGYPITCVNNTAVVISVALFINTGIVSVNQNSIFGIILNTFSLEGLSLIEAHFVL